MSTKESNKAATDKQKGDIQILWENYMSMSLEKKNIFNK